MNLGRITSLLFVLALFLTTSCERQDKDHARPTTSQETSFERVQRTRVLRAAYIPYAPAVIIDPNTKALSGIFVDTLRRLGETLHVEVQFVAEETFAGFSEGLKSGRYDIVCANIWPNASRSFHMYFSEPLYFSGMCVWVRTEDHRFDNGLDGLNAPDVRLATMDGEISELIAKDQFPLIGRTEAPQTSSFSVLLENVASKKADVLFMEPHTVQAFLANHPGALRNITPVKPLRIYPNTFPVPLGDERFKAMIDTAVTELINAGYIDTLLKRYSKEPGSFFPVSYPFRTDQRN